MNQLKGFLEKLINCEILQNCLFFQVEQGENLTKCEESFKVSFIHIHLESILWFVKRKLQSSHIICWIFNDRFITLWNQCTMTVYWLKVASCQVHVHVPNQYYRFVFSSWCQQENSKYDIFHRTQSRSVNSSTCKSFRSFLLLIVHFTTGGGWDPLIIFCLT